MSLSSPAWSQREKVPCDGNLAALLQASSSDSDSGCALEDYSAPTTEILSTEVSPHFGSYSSDADPAAIQSLLRIKALLQQLPPQDNDERYCPSIGEEERKELRTFAIRRRQESLGQGVTCLMSSTAHGSSCKKCGKKMHRGEQGVVAPRLGDQYCWHIACFVCHTCHQPLVDLIYFHWDGKIYCGRHHAEFFRPRCASCDQLIFTSECMEAEGMRWHEEHFCCLECDLPLGARRYVMKGSQPCCCACFESLYADVCQACGEIIGVDSEQATLQGQHWHAKASCFCCSLCQKALLGQLVTIQNGHLFCSEVCSLEKESALSSTGSDSSDSAFISAPSPDSTPTSRAKNSSPGCSSTAARANSNVCEQVSEANAIETFHTSGNFSVRTQFSSPEEEVVLGNRAVTPQLDELELLEENPQEYERISITHLLEDQSTVHVREHQVLGASLQNPSQPQAGHYHFRNSLATASNSSVLIMNFPRRLHEVGTSEQEPVEEQDRRCPTCSSSSDSDSEPEGFFFGKPIPKPGARCIAVPSRGQQQTFDKGVRRAVRARESSKHCSIS